MKLGLHLFPANLGDSACISEIVQAISAVRQFGGRPGMIRQPQCRNWLHCYRITCRLSKIGRKKVYMVLLGPEHGSDSFTSLRVIVSALLRRKLLILCVADLSLAGSNS